MGDIFYNIDIIRYFYSAYLITSNYSKCKYRVKICTICQYKKFNSYALYICCFRPFDHPCSIANDAQSNFSLQRLQPVVASTYLKAVTVETQPLQAVKVTVETRTHTIRVHETKVLVQTFNYFWDTMLAPYISVFTLNQCSSSSVLLVTCTKLLIGDIDITGNVTDCIVYSYVYVAFVYNLYYFFHH